MTELTVHRTRIHSIDIVRGFVMIIMALDHVRDFFHNDAFLNDPTNLETTNPWLFFTRWITHFCAPVFVFLAGTSAFLSGQRKTKKQLSKFLITRGLWLVFVELFIVTLGWTFNPLYNVFILQVIWAIGISMIILGLLVLLSFKVILIYGLLVVFGHNLLNFYPAAASDQGGVLWNIVYAGFFYLIPLGEKHFAIIIYAFMPWSGVMALGYCFGVWFQNNVSPALRKKRLIWLGTGMILLFIVLRFINIYGDPAQFAQQSRGAFFSFLSFINTTKYPPSLLFLCMTLGPAIIALAFLEKTKSRAADFCMLYGRVPFFYYVLHFYIIHLLCVVAFFASGYTTSQIITPEFPFLFRPPTFGFDLWAVYVIWMAVVLILYPLCRWYSRYKATHGHWWLSYL
jgi:uncharacterized membrane protein